MKLPADYASDEALNVATRRALARARTGQDAIQHPTRLSDPSGLTTGRYTLTRHVFIVVGGRPAAWCWRVRPEAARGVEESFLDRITKPRDFTVWSKALAYATQKARENIR